ncbi:hypothetical protein A2X44_00635 [candidate division CPR3 bacterium GWF2_35_18]|uniref:ATP synthase protein I n=1 Tax=candidate division CPR3 bacterium GW2011_GWF2_35_18 TaxID=1618350 RepID=A0A0G0E4D1_UNCC3|nr:MAG: hypothetical protein UR67_C0001G0109 [candidate division CPR3 bacterium GW2011_GWF2_35_18]KKP86341.1 MAG: hypothetical protein UR87_C0022G0021 [candidate division CPR3 bacterium GW2011_GWE2_35_7]OGB63420.1 MAG: hypothetical protein A2X44_00635 [candidate division CPR3 bacterium GWF2_35_18]OGB64835.1 MAG: hypothetical protein A2250_05395 [candidate division CPR3 bacterium RIFOXYA2_FULL_35_13]OGB76952.1 MAG: hypothetical protein A2476_05215 [candidate division CPR3 bacterium RIFOXYC2_FULL
MTDKNIANKKIPVSSTREVMFGLSFVFNFGFVILVPALLGIFLGLTLDNKFGTKPIATVISLTVGMILGFGAGIFQVKQFINKSKKT